MIHTAKPYVVGLTGGMASGKSTVLAAFKACGVFTVSADDLARQVRAQAQVQDFLQQEFGSADPAVIARQVFANPQQRQALEAHIHPLVWQAAQKQLAASGARWAVFEVPLLFESGWDKYMDLTLLILAGEETLSARLKERGLTREDYISRLKTQWSPAQKAARADVILTNRSTKTDLEQKVCRLARALDTIYG